MIRMALPVHPTEGYGLDLTCPVIACDYCGRIIDAEHPGILLYIYDDDTVQHHVHKGACDRRFEAEMGDRRHRFFWRDLDEWLLQLSNNYNDPLIPKGGRDFTLDSGDTFHANKARYLRDDAGRAKRIKEVADA